VNIKLFLTYVIFLVFLWSFPGPVLAQEENPAETPKGIVFVELFSSQACAFCPRADDFMHEIVRQEDAIALSCHIDYFDVEEGSLARPFCTQRQKEYAGTLGSGTLYTPQMVINGRDDIIGYKTEKVARAIDEARDNPAPVIEIEEAEPGKYQFRLNAQEIPEGARPRIWMAVIDKPHVLTISEGGNKGKGMTYMNIVSAMKTLGPWSGQAVARDVRPELGPGQAGFIIAAQDMATGEILAAGQYWAVRH